MCGIAGIFSTNELKLSDEINIMASAIRRRGPDKSQVKKSRKHHAAFSRLSIVDLDDRAMQPMLSANNRFQISFNGEIYNRFELKQNLENLTTITLQTSSDTEIFLEYISYFGLDKALEDAEGMFGFSLEDHEKNELILCVDKFGQKPIYWGESNKKLYYSSDFKSLINLQNFKNLNESKIQEYFTYGYIAAPDTLIKNIKKLEAGSYLIFSNSVEIRSYYCIAKDINFLKTDREVEELKENFESTILEMTDLDVSYACLLSGGVDSSLISSAIKKLKGDIKTYCIAFPGTKYDESQHALKVAKAIKSKHTTLELPNERMIEIIKNYPDFFAEPMIDFASIPLIFASSEIKEKVVFIGDGGDELYGGYHEYYNKKRKLWEKKRALTIQRMKILNPLLPLKLKGVFSRKLTAANNKMNFINYFHLNEGLHNEKLSNNSFSISSKLKNNYTSSAWQESLTLYSYENKLQNQFLPKLDRSSMGNGKEFRAPFLNLKHLKFKFENFGIDFNNRKLQKDLLSLYIHPSITDKPKKGFSIPFEIWLRKELYSWAREVIEETQLSNEILNKKLSLDRLKFHKYNLFDDSNFLWKSLNFLNWLRLYNIKS